MTCFSPFTINGITFYRKSLLYTPTIKPLSIRILSKLGVLTISVSTFLYLSISLVLRTRSLVPLVVMVVFCTQ